MSLSFICVKQKCNFFLKIQYSCDFGACFVWIRNDFACFIATRIRIRTVSWNGFQIREAEMKRIPPRRIRIPAIENGQRLIIYLRVTRDNFAPKLAFTASNFLEWIISDELGLCYVYLKPVSLNQAVKGFQPSRSTQAFRSSLSLTSCNLAACPVNLHLNHQLNHQD